MKIKIGYKKKSGETAGFVIRIDYDGTLWVAEPQNNTEEQLSFWLEDYKEESAVFLGVDEDEN